MNSFIPDLVVEVTSVCNRACNGCYAPNVVSNTSASELIKQDPSLFLGFGDLQKAVLLLEELPHVISVRGGEPSLHPELPSLLNLLSYFSKSLVIESHGRWLLKEERDSYKHLIDAARRNSVSIKISFDSMHRLKTNQLFEMVSFLDAHKINYYIAITESSLEDFSTTRNSIQWVQDERIFFQKKGKSSDELVKPRLGVINSKGQLKEGLNTRFNEKIDLVAFTTEVAAG